MEFAVDTVNLTKYYGKSRGIIDVTMQIEPGEIFGFIGPNGAGKSTTIRTLLALLRPTSGDARIFGMNCISDRTEIAKRVGYLPSEVFYYDHMRVRDLLFYSAGFYRKDCRKRIIDLSERLDLDLTRKIEDLSLGNKKKVGIVQGLLHDPDLIILDEPTLGLDPLMQQTFYSLILDENARGATILMSSHILREVQRICGRIAIIKEGKIIKTDRIANMKEQNVRRFALETPSDISFLPIRVSGVHDFVSKDKNATFIFDGDLSEILRTLAELKIESLTISEPDLEEIFLHYYSKEG